MTTVIDRETLQRMTTDPQTRLLDVLPPDQFENGHLPGAQNVPLKDLSDWARSANKNSPVITYCNDAL